MSFRSPIRTGPESGTTPKTGLEEQQKKDRKSNKKQDRKSNKNRGFRLAESPVMLAVTL